MPRPTRRVPLATLAATLTIGPLLTGLTLGADPVTVRPGDTVTAIARRHGLSVEDIASLNRLSDPNRIYAGQRLRVDAKEATAKRPTKAAKASKAPAARARDASHTVRRGEHLTGIARSYGVSVRAIVTANRIANPSRIYAGQRIVIPATTTAAAKPKPSRSSAPKATSTARRSHTVQRGEHLTGIARRYGVKLSDIAAANGIANPSRIYAGQRLVIPGTGAAPAPSRKASVPRSVAAVMKQRDDMRRLIVAEARRYDVPASLALAVAWQESGWRQNVVSHAGAIGVMQLLPATGEWVGTSMLGQRVDLRSARDNVRAGVRLLDHYLARYDGNVDLVLAAYYQGQTAADRHGVYPVSRPYVASIRALVRMLGG